MSHRTPIINVIMVENARIEIKDLSSLQASTTLSRPSKSLKGLISALKTIGV
jgi:hypothetical protein